MRAAFENFPHQPGTKCSIGIAVAAARCQLLWKGAVAHSIVVKDQIKKMREEGEKSKWK